MHYNNNKTIVKVRKANTIYNRVNTLYMAKKVRYSFLPGCGKVKKEDYKALNDELKNILGCKTLQYYYTKRKEFIDMPAHLKEDIEAVFLKYGITDPAEIWSITEVEP